MRNSNSVFVTSLVCALALIGCTRGPRDVSQEIVRPLDNSEVILEFNGGTITAGDVREKMTPRLEQAREALLNEYVHAANDVFVSRKQNPDSDKEIKVGELELDAYIKANHIPEAEKSKIHGFLLGEKKRLAREESARALSESLRVVNKLGSARFKVADDQGAPAKGPAGAAVTVQLFCDFANPLCNRARLLIRSTENQFGDKVRWVFRFFPVASNAGSFAAAAVALCAHDQGAFWAAHDKLLDNGPAVAKEDFVQIIASLPKVDAKKLRACTQAEDTKKRLEAEVHAGQDLGITSTPVYFIGDLKFLDAEKVTAAIQAHLEH